MAPDDPTREDLTGTEGPGSDGDGSERLFRVLGEYVDRLNDGEVIDRGRIAEEHPDLAAELLQRLEAFVEVGREGSAEEPLATLGDYRLMRQIGRGGMGVVYQAWQGSMDRPVALKVLPAGFACDSRTFMRFMREARTAGKLNHPNVVSVYGMGVESSTPYYAMEYVEGETLGQDLARPGREVDLPRCLELASAIAGVADGLQHAHQKGIVHRDIKPSNIIQDRDGRLRILDFGLARQAGEDSLTATGGLLGTPLYMSPEQARARRIPVDHRTDLYSLGATLYHLLSGQPPFRGDDHQDTVSRIIHRDPTSLRSLNPRIPRDLENIVMRCLRKDPADRYGTAEALAQDLRRFARGDPVEARPQPGWEKLRRAVRRRKTGLLLSAACVLLALTGGLLFRQHLIRNAELKAARYRDEVTDAVMMLELGEITVRAGEGKPVAIDPQNLFVPGDFRTLAEDSGLDPLEQAVAKLEAAAALFPRRPEARYHRARGLSLLGRPEEALLELDRAAQGAPDFLPAAALRHDLADPQGSGGGAPGGPGRDEAPDGWRGLWKEAYRAVQGEEWRRAADLYARLIRESARAEPYLGSLVEFQLGEGRALLECGEHSAAIESFIAARTLWPAAKVPRLLLGKAYYEKGEMESAERTFQALHDLAEGRRDEAALWVAALYKYFREFERGLAWAGKLKQERLRLRLEVDFNTLLGRWDEAIRLGLAAIERFPDDALTHHFLAVSLLRKDAPRGLEVARRAYELNPASADTLSLLAAAYQSNGQPERARELYLKAIQLAPDEPRGYDHLGRLLRRLGELDESERRFRQAVEIVERKGRYHFLDPHAALAGLLYSRGRFEEGLGFYQKAARLSPRHPLALRACGSILRRLGRREEAERCLRKALKAHPDDAGAMQQLGLIEVQEGRTEEGIGSLRRAVGMNPRDLSAASNLGWALERAGRGPEAFAVYVDALAAWPGTRWIHEKLIDLGRRPGAEEVLAPEWDRVAQAIEAAPEEARQKPGLMNTLAVALSRGRERRDLERARETARTAVEKSRRKAAECLDTLAGMEFLAGNLEEAVRLAGEAVALPGASRSHAEALRTYRERLGIPEKGDLFLEAGEPEPSDRRFAFERIEADQPIRIDCGGDGFEAPSGEVWEKDRFFRGGAPAPPTAFEISGTELDPLYRTARRFAPDAIQSGYRIPVPAGTYRVALHFTETTHEGRYPRLMDVLIEGAPALGGHDLAKAGFAVADVQVLESVVKDGILDLEFRAEDGEAIVSAIEVQRKKG